MDAIVFAFVEGKREVLLIQRKNPPFKGLWAFPGGFVDMNETLEEAVKRELEEETSLQLENLQQFKAYSRVDRDPRGRAISVAFVAKLTQKPSVKANDDAVEAGWFSLNNLPNLAFDHNQILQEVITNL